MDTQRVLNLFSTVPMEFGTSTENRIFADITKLLEKENGRISRRDLSSRMHYSGNYLNRLVKKYTGLNLTEYADSIALRAAALLLINTDLTISEILDQLSFTNRSYFYKKFEKVYACTPKKFRANHRI